MLSLSSNSRLLVRREVKPDRNKRPYAGRSNDPALQQEIMRRITVANNCATEPLPTADPLGLLVSRFVSRQAQDNCAQDTASVSPGRSSRLPTGPRSIVEATW